MFKKKKSKINPNTTDTLIGEGSVFEGRIRSEASLRVEGIINGDIECVGDVTIGEHGHAKSNIIARNVTIAGMVQGNVSTRGLLTITATGQLFGNTLSHTLLIAEGGVFQGQSKMQQESKNNIASDKIDKDKEQPGQAYNPTYGSSTTAI
jgi:cytoskeletal protein CcmA (bactofilin family)